jgi:hypothetical protein
MYDEATELWMVRLSGPEEGGARGGFACLRHHDAGAKLPSADLSESPLDALDAFIRCRFPLW